MLHGVWAVLELGGEGLEVLLIWFLVDYFAIFLLRALQACRG